VAQAGERTRLVLNLKQASGYRAQLQGKALLLVLDASGPPIAAAGEPTQFAPRRTPDRKGCATSTSAAAGRRRPRHRGLPSTQVGVDIRQQGPEPGGRVPALHAARQPAPRLDVTDFGTPVQTVSTFQSGDRVRMVVEPVGSWEHSAYQSDNQFVLEVRPVKVDPNKLTQGPASRARS
jgi:type IV pilus assembly protein PilQ